jgi:hypothetical protein
VMGTGITNSSEDYKGVNMGGTPASDKASKMIDREPTSPGLKKNSMPDRERSSPGGKKNLMDKPLKDGFDPKSRGK